MKPPKDPYMPPAFKPINCVYIDIDGTLLMKDGSYNQDLIEWIKDKCEAGWQICFWSARGWEHAIKHAQACRLAELCHGYMTKPSLIIDDWGTGWSQWTKVVKPSAIGRSKRAAIANNFQTMGAAKQQGIS